MSQRICRRAIAVDVRNRASRPADRPRLADLATHVDQRGRRAQKQQEWYPISCQKLSKTGSDTQLLLVHKLTEHSIKLYKAARSVDNRLAKRLQPGFWRPEEWSGALAAVKRGQVRRIEHPNYFLPYNWAKPRKKVANKGPAKGNRHLPIPEPWQAEQSKRFVLARGLPSELFGDRRTKADAEREAQAWIHGAATQPLISERA
jgi:hypothetical protein